MAKKLERWLSKICDLMVDLKKIFYLMTIFLIILIGFFTFLIFKLDFANLTNSFSFNKTQKEENESIYYFAYGLTCSKSILEKTIEIEDYRKAYAKDVKVVFQTFQERQYGIANLVEEKGSVAYGALYKTKKKYLKNIEEKLGNNYNLKQKTIEVFDFENKNYKAITYYFENGQPAGPSSVYIEAYFKALKEAGYEERDIKKILNQTIKNLNK
jgi:hypothetical protein